MLSWIQIKGNKRSGYSSTIPSNKIKFNKYNNNLGYDVVLREKQEENAIWYKGDSNLLLEFYINSRKIFAGNFEIFRNSKDYFWAVAGAEDGVKCTHSGLPKAMVGTLVKILGKPEIKASKDEINDDGNIKQVDDIVVTSRIKKIIEENDFYSILMQDQEPFTMVIGDGAYLINVDSNISDLPIIEYIDGRNIEFERRANRIVSVTARKYYSYENKGYMLTDTRSTRLIEDTDNKDKKKRIATIEYHLYRLNNLGSDEVVEEVSLKDIPDTKDLESLEFPNIDCMLAVPCVYDLDKDTGRGESIFAGKLDLFDDLDQSKSQSSNVTRLSTPIDYIPEQLIDYDNTGKPKKPTRYDRRFIVLKGSINAVGQNIDKVETTQPDLDFNQYSTAQLELVMDILDGIMSPATLGIDLARKDNATAQREKEKVTLITRDNLVDKQTVILQKLFNLLLKVDEYIKNPNKRVNDYNITINYPEYANPTFENKLAYLTPAYASGGMTEEQYVNELWEDALTEEEKQKEIQGLIERRTSSFQQFNNQLDDTALE